MGQERHARMHAHPIRQRTSRRSRLIVALLLGELLVVIPVATFAAPPASHHEVSVSAAVSTADCNAVTVDFVINWRGVRGGADANLSAVELQAIPGSFTLTSIALEPGRKTDKQKGTIEGQLLRESGYFDHQTYAGLSYRVVVNTANGDWVSSEPLAIPDCVPLAPTSGPGAGGTSVTVYGGGTFGGPIFSMSSTMFFGGTAVSPTSVAADGSSMTVVAPSGAAGSCVTVTTEPGLPFSLPGFCYTS